jgi:hypothetical protein
MFASQVGTTQVRLLALPTNYTQTTLYWKGLPGTVLLSTLINYRRKKFYNFEPTVMLHFTRAQKLERGKTPPRVKNLERIEIS